MRREDLEHLIRAAGAITGSRRIIVIGSQSVLGQFPYNAPWRATLSMEADLLPIDKPETTALITGSLGELSPFHTTFGYYGDGVSLETARLPTHWQDRLVPVENANTNGYVGLCLDVHDAMIAKYFAGREKDHEFCAALASSGLVDATVLRERLDVTELDDTDRARIAAKIDAHFQQGRA